MAPMTPLGWFFRARSRPFVYESADDVPTRSVVIVPGARVRDGEPSVVLGDRLSGALDLLHAGTVDRALISGGPVEIPVMRRWRRDRGISSDRIQSDPGGLRTLLTMERAKALFAIEGAVIATNRFHLPRAVLLARAMGIDAVGLVVDRQVYAKKHRDEAREVVAQGRALVDLGVRRFQG
ncbi:MAG: YdcF family protein [Deltaproteobacteria bacterium]|nr:YdcF family protein [Deltaproteobacteria bacterium]